MNDDADRVFRDAFEALRLRHLAFRRADDDEIREIEAMRLEVIRAEGETHPSVDLGVYRISHLRLRLMERAFYVLRLEYYASARENIGWMNLFRGWAEADAFREQYERLKQTLSPQFRGLYEACVASFPKGDPTRPVHHPWLRGADDQGPGMFMDSGRTEPGVYPAGTRAGAGGVVDSKGQSGVDQGYEGGGPTEGGGPSAPNA